MAYTSSTPNNTDIIPTSGLDMNEEVSKLAEFFPQFVKDGEIDFAAFKAWFSENGQLADTDEKYGLGWAGKSDAIKAIRRKATGTLKPDKEQSKDWDTTSNLFIEGDNLEVLKLLMRQYANKVKMIYIDPPYNTGKDFVYKDNFHEGVSDYYQRTGQDKEGSNYGTNTSSSGRYHSSWLNMMYPRLFFAKQMLVDDGMIFVSIDDNEVFNLRLAMNEVFGEDNFIAQIVWEKRYGRSNDAKLFANNNDYILLYRKSDELKTLREPRGDSQDSIYTNIDNDPRGPWTSVSFVSQRTLAERPNLAYELKNPFTGEVTSHPSNAWKYNKEKYEQLLADNRLYWGKDGQQKFPRIKRFLNELADGVVPINLWKHQETGTGDLGTREVENLVGKDMFDYPKPTKMLKRVLNVGTKSNNSDIVMDFFSGSGSLAHAVMDLNALDGGNRKWICVQLPEETPEKSEARKAGYSTIPEIARERIRRAGEKIINDNADNIVQRKSPLDTGFKAFALASSNYRQWQPIDSEAENIQQLLLDQAKQSVDHPLVDDYDELDVLYEIALKEGADLNADVVEASHKNLKIYTIADTDRKIIVTFAEKLSSDFTEGLGMAASDLLVCLDNSLTDADKANLLQNIKLKTI